MPAKSTGAPAFTVYVDDNFHYQDESYRYEHGAYDSLDAAIAACKAIVDEYLESANEPGMSADALYASYTSFGEDPFIASVSPDVFSAWRYARQCCNELCAPA